MGVGTLAMSAMDICPVAVRPLCAPRRGARPDGCVGAVRSAALPPHHGVWIGVGCGRGRRPRRPAYTWRSRGRSMGVQWARRAEDVAPYHGYGQDVGVWTGVRAW